MKHTEAQKLALRKLLEEDSHSLNYWSIDFSTERVLVEVGTVHTNGARERPTLSYVIELNGTVVKHAHT